MIVYFDCKELDPRFFNFVEEVSLSFKEPDRPAMRQWLEHNGSGAVVVSETIFRYEYYFTFRFEDINDATLFKLRWGGV